MTDAWVVVLAASVAAGAWAAHPLPLPAGLVVAVAGLAWRRPVVLCAGAALLASALGARAWAGVHPPLRGPVRADVVLMTDPADSDAGVRADVRLAGKHVEAHFRGSSEAAVRPRLAGEHLRVDGTVRPVPPRLRERLARRHVGAELDIRVVRSWRSGDTASRAANGLRRTLLAGVRGLPPTHRQLFAGFVLGDDRGQPVEVVDDFRASGLAHLLVVSGENVAFVLALASPLLTRLPLGGRLAVGLAVLAAFGVVVRWEPSVLRAEAMAALGLLAFTLGRPVSAVRLLALAVVAVILVDPLIVGSVGFLLSVGACAGIALLSRPIAAAIPGPRWLVTPVAVTAAAQLGVAPVLVPVFGGMPVAALPANLLAVPAAGPVMMWGLIVGVPAGLAGGALARVAHAPTDMLVGWIALVARRAASLPLGQLGTGHVVALAAAVGLGLRRRTRALAVAIALVIAVTPALRIAVPTDVDGRPLPGGGRLWRARGATVVSVERPRAGPLLTALHQAGVTRVDVLVVGRPSVRHALEPVTRRLPPGRVLVGPFSVSTDPATRAVQVRSGRAVVSRSEGVRHHHPLARDGDPQPHP